MEGWTDMWMLCIPMSPAVLICRDNYATHIHTKCNKVDDHSPEIKDKICIQHSIYVFIECSVVYMMTPWCGNVFNITGPMWGGMQRSSDVEPWCFFVQWLEMLCKNYAHGRNFEVLWCGLVQVNFTHSFQFNPTGTRAILQLIPFTKGQIILDSKDSQIHVN